MSVLALPRTNTGVMLNYIFAKRVWRSTIAATLAIIGAAYSGAAQQPTATGAAQAQVITLEDAIEIALERNPTVRQAENSARNSTLNLSQQRRQLLPDLNLTTGSGIPYAYGNSDAQGDPTVTAGFSSSMQVGNIYNTLANIRQARINEDQSEESLTRTRQTIVSTVMTQYLDLIQAMEQVEVQDSNLVAVLAQEANVQAQVTAGRRPQSDLFQQQAATASARLSVLQTRSSVISSRQNLMRTLQLDPFGEYQFVVPELGPLSTTFDSLDLQSISQQALERRPDLRAAQLSVASAEQGLRVASASRWPSVSVSVGYNSGSFSSGSNGDIFNQLDQGRRGNINLNVSVPILDFTYGITRERAQIALENARISLENSRQGVLNEVRTAYLNLQLLEQQLVVAEAQLTSANLARQTAQQRYDVGVATLLEVTQAQLAQVRAEQTLVNARYDLILASRLIAYTIGTLPTGVE